MGVLSENTMQSLRPDVSNFSPGNQYVAQTIMKENRNGKLLETNRDGLEINGSKVDFSIEKLQSFNDNPIAYIKSSSNIEGDFWRATAINKGGTICYRLEYINGEHSQDRNGIEQNKLPFVVNVEKVDNETFDKISKIIFDTGYDQYRKGIESGNCSGSHLSQEHVQRAELINEKYGKQDNIDKITDIYKEIKMENGQEKEYLIIRRESGLVSIHPSSLLKDYEKAKYSLNIDMGMTLKPITMYYEHPSRAMFLEKMCDPEFKSQLVENMTSENPIEQIFYYNQKDMFDTEEDMVEERLGIPIGDFEDSDKAELHILISTISYTSEYEETMANESYKL